LVRHKKASAKGAPQFVLSDENDNRYQAAGKKTPSVRVHNHQPGMLNHITQ